MKLREIVEKTGISKRNIHFYIKEGLLHPDVAPGSGYYEFSEEEEKRLLLIREYRNAGLPLAVIRSLLDQPSTAGFFLTWQVIRLKQQAASCERILSGLEQILDELPLHPDLDTLSSVTSGAGIPEASGQPFPDAGSDAILLVNRFLWNQFLPDGLVTEYQKYLWDKLNRTAEKRCPEDYAVLFSSLQSLSLTQMGRMLSQRSAHYDRIVSLREEECEDYAREMQKGLISFLENDALLSFWKKNYARFFLPEVRIFSSGSVTLLQRSALFSAPIRSISTLPARSCIAGILRRRQLPCGGAFPKICGDTLIRSSTATAYLKPCIPPEN